MATVSRQRVTVDLRGAADRLHAFAAARQMTTAAVVRLAIRQTLDGQVGADSAVTHPVRTLIDRAAVKVTVRLAPRPRPHSSHEPMLRMSRRGTMLPGCAST